MNYDELKNIWKKKYNIVNQQLDKVKEIQTVATAFNTNIDAIFKISGKQIEELIEKNNINGHLLRGKETENF